MSIINNGEETSSAVSGSYTDAQVRAIYADSPDFTILSVNQESSATGITYKWNGASTDSSNIESEFQGIATAGLGSISGSPTGGIGNLNLGSYLNSLGTSVINFFKQFIPSFSLWWIVAIVLLLVFGGIFFVKFSEGLGEGIAAKV